MTQDHDGNVIRISPTPDLVTLVHHAERIQAHCRQRVEQYEQWAGSVTPFPCFVALTDPRVPDFLEGVLHLPVGSAVILRHYQAPDRTTMAQRLRILTRQRHILLLVAGDVDLARACHADGVHLPRWLLPTLRPDTCRRWQRENGWRLTASVHTRSEHDRACEYGVDAALLSPIFPTRSHPEHPGLGVKAVADITRTSPIPILGLGGITAVTAPRLHHVGLWGIAGVSGFWPLMKNKADPPPKMTP